MLRHSNKSLKLQFTEMARTKESCSFAKNSSYLEFPSHCTSVNTTESGILESVLHHRQGAEDKLSVSVVDIDFPFLPKEMLKEISTKAQKLLVLSNSVVKAPGFDGIFAQHSPSDNTDMNPPCMITLN